MKAGVFMMPSHPPERDFHAGHMWDLEHLELCDNLVFTKRGLANISLLPGSQIQLQIC